MIYFQGILTRSESEKVGGKYLSFKFKSLGSYMKYKELVNRFRQPEPTPVSSHIKTS